MKYIKRGARPSQTDVQRIRSDVERMLADIESRREDAVFEYAEHFDGWRGDFILAQDECRVLGESVSDQVKDDIRFAHDQIRSFADEQRALIRDMEIEHHPGVRLGHRVLPVDCAGCYIPGGRYAHAASALMSVATAKAAGVGNVIACTPPRGETIDPAVAYALTVAGADTVFQMGGVHAIATMAHGLFTGDPAQVIVGPGNAYVTEAKRSLFGRVGIDLVAGPTESAVLCDESADPMTVAVDLVSQAEHGPTSPVWLVTTSEEIARQVMSIVPRVIDELPQPHDTQTAWDDCGEIVVCANREEMADVSDRYAPEHVQVMAADLDWWRERLRNYGSLFLGEGSTVTHGDKCSGTNHVLPTNGAACYTGGLGVHKFMKTVTYQQVDPESNRTMSAVASRISRLEGMEAHARACDWRLRKYFPDVEWEFPVHRQTRYD